MAEQKPLKGLTFTDCGVSAGEVATSMDLHMSSSTDESVKVGGAGLGANNRMTPRGRRERKKAAKGEVGSGKREVTFYSSQVRRKG